MPVKGLTKGLACANITDVMEKIIQTSTKDNLLNAGLDLFCQKDYKSVGLRQICASCGVTTGAFYFFFPNKDALLCAIVDPVIQRLWSLTKELEDRELLHPDTAPDNDRATMEFLLTYRREILILMEKSAGSSREGFCQELFDTMSGYFTQSFSAAIGRQPRGDVIDMLVRIRITAIMDILKGAETMEQAFFLNDVLSHYADSGFNCLVHNLKDVL